MKAKRTHSRYGITY